MKNTISRFLLSKRFAVILAIALDVYMLASYAIALFLLVDARGDLGKYVGAFLFFANGGLLLNQRLKPEFYGLSFWRIMFMPWSAVLQWRKAKAHHEALAYQVSTEYSKRHQNGESIDFSSWSVSLLTRYLEATSDE